MTYISPCLTTCLDMYSLSCVSIWVRELSCSAKDPACMAALCHEAAGGCPLWVACCLELCREYFLCARMPLVVRAHTRVPCLGAAGGHPFPLAAASAACGRGWGGASVGCARAHAKLSTRPCARPAPPAQRSERLSLPLSAPPGRRLLQAGASVRWAARPEAGRRVRRGCLGP